MSETIFKATRFDSGSCRVVATTILLPHHVVPFLRSLDAGAETVIGLLAFDETIGGLRETGAVPVVVTGGRALAPMFSSSLWGITFAQQYSEATRTA